MATDFVVLLPEHALARDGRGAVEVAVEALESVEQLEQRFSVYLPDSEVSRLNRLGAIEPVRLSSETFEVLVLAQEIARQTDGAFDVTAGPLVECWGFTKRTGRKPSAEAIDEALQRVGWRKLELDQKHSTARFAVPGMQINLGGIGKGFAIDCVAKRLRQNDVHDFVIHGGNSSVLASGHSEADDEANRGWLIGVTHPKHPRRRLGGIWLKDQALGTSGPGKQFFHHRGKRYGHVIDPRSGWPAGDLEALTVIAESAADADALATGWFVAGKAVALPAAAADPALAVVAVEATDRQAGVRVEVANLDEGRWVPEQAGRIE
ncbi:MAG: FAD:protein FMN transferase [Pirellulaceae bacterium]